MADYSTPGVPARECLLKALNYIKDAIEYNMSLYGRNASETSVKSLVASADDHIGVLKGEKSFIWMERGRKKGGIPKGFHQILLQWISDKGLSVDPKSDNKFAACLARKIRDKGTYLHQSKMHHDIMTTATNTAVQNLAHEMRWWASVQVEKYWKQDYK